MNLTRINYFLAIGFGSGLAPKAPGTFGTLLVGLPCAWLLSYATASFNLPILAVVAGMVVLTLLSVVSCSLAEDYLGTHDDKSIVLDEVVGMMWAGLLLLPGQWLYWMLAFGLFRFFDVIKPYPISISQNLPKGWGIVIDDVLAGIASLFLLYGLKLCEDLWSGPI